MTKCEYYLLLTQLVFRGDRLTAAGELHRFFDAVRKTETWATETHNSLCSAEVPHSVAEADELIAKHREKLAGIDGRQVVKFFQEIFLCLLSVELSLYYLSKFQREMMDLREWGEKLMAEQPDHKGEIQRRLRRLQNVEHQLRVAWDKKNMELARARNWQLFSDRANRAEQWLAAKEVFLKQVGKLLC